MVKFNNRGNHFFIEVIPDINEKGEWQGPLLHYIAIRRIEFKGCPVEVVDG